MQRNGRRVGGQGREAGREGERLVGREGLRKGGGRRKTDDRKIEVFAERNIT